MVGRIRCPIFYWFKMLTGSRHLDCFAGEFLQQ